MQVNYHTTVSIMRFLHVPCREVMVSLRTSLTLKYCHNAGSVGGSFNDGRDQDYLQVSS